MPDTFNWITDPIVAEGFSLAVASLIAHAIVIGWVLILSYLANFMAKRVILRLVARVIARTRTTWDDILLEQHVFDRLSHLAPALVIYVFAGLAFSEVDALRNLIERVALVYMIIVSALVIDGLLNGAIDIYSTLEISRSKPIKSYIQVVKLFVYLITGILVLAMLLDRSPWAFLSGLGALTAVIMLVFKDTILGFVASIQLVSHDMVRLGDWIEMPRYGADGDVIDITLNTVKVQNFDKTITTIPTYALVSDSFKNWSGMYNSNGRRIKRALLIDMHSIEFCPDAILDRFERVELISDYVKRKRTELQVHNADHDIDPDIQINTRRLTNIGTFRAYIEAYLKADPRIEQKMTLLVRQLAPAENGLPIELYVFLKERKDWKLYESSMADIFDHLLAVLPEFNLRVYQAPSGSDFRRLTTE